MKKTHRRGAILGLGDARVAVGGGAVGAVAHGVVGRAAGAVTAAGGPLFRAARGLVGSAARARARARPAAAREILHLRRVHNRS